jgi:acyl-CoA synthetase (AMP-forming)/AMP-acid ligase II
VTAPLDLDAAGLRAPARRRPAWLRSLHDHAGRVAVHSPEGVLTYAELGERVADVADRLAGARRLVLLEGRSTVTTVAALLAAQEAGHVVLLVPAGRASRDLRAAYQPDVVVGADGRVDVLREQSAHELHPDLALLLSTSGSTGSPKLVRLSAANLEANAAQIVQALGVRADDCAALTLPLTYSYGLSVLTTHLAVGASVLLTDTSVVDECFWRAATAAGVTTLPGVPHTFELLERSGFADRELPSLRCLTQAGGRMEPDRVRGFAELGERKGFDLHVMYGQSEATARMAVLAPDLAAQRPDTVGRAVPGGELTIDDGEVVFRGPNVMLGYANGPADLALGRVVHELRTGDLGEITPDGLLRVTGRRSRFVKVLGHRIDLDVLERRLRDDGFDVTCAGRDGVVALAVAGAPPATRLDGVRRAACRRCGAPRDAVRVVAVDELPVLPNGKPDQSSVLRLATGADRASAGATEAPAPAESVAELYAKALGGDVRDDSTFVGLGGDSLSYVEVSVRLEDLLGRLPEGWHLMPVAELESLRHPTPGETPQPPRRARWSAMESSIWLRALAIVLIVGTHAKLFTLQGTANALLVIAGYQLARFQLSHADPLRRTRGILRAAVRVVVPTVVVVAAAHVFVGDYEVRNLFLANWAFGQPRLGPPWRFWFVEALVVALVLVAALVRLAVVARLDRRFPLGLPLALTAVTFGLFRVPWWTLPVPRMQGSALVVLHLFFLGWALARARGPAQRLLVSAVVIGVVGTFSWNHQRDGLTIAVVLVMLWFPVTRVPSSVVPVVRVLAAASLYVYVIHWQALELLWGHPVVAFAGSLALGVAYWWFWSGPVTGAWRALSRRLTARA